MNPDVAIIGTGPGGGVAACILAQSGLRVRLLDSKILPRTKPCGGLMPGGVTTIFDWDTSSLVDHRLNQLEYFHNYQHQHLNQLGNGELLLVDRSKFDLGLIQHALAASRGDTSLLQASAVKLVEEDADGVSISGEGFLPFRARYVIAADGVASRTARCLGLNPTRKSGVTIDVELRVSDSCYDRYSDRVIFNYFCLPQGYGWIFPKKPPILSCGVGTWGGRTGVRESVHEFISRNFAPNEVLDQAHLGFPIPIYSGQTTIASKRVCLVGDAASLVNPVSGEGIRFAMWSGMLAAKSIMHLIAKEESGKEEISGCQHYQNTVYSETTRSLDHSLRFATLPFLHAPDLYYQKFIKDCSGNPHYT
jgi:geranylgeranyl reductase family protein